MRREGDLSEFQEDPEVSRVAALKKELVQEFCYKLISRVTQNKGKELTTISAALFERGFLRVLTAEERKHYSLDDIFIELAHRKMIIDAKKTPNEENRFTLAAYELVEKLLAQKAANEITDIHPESY